MQGECFEVTGLCGRKTLSGQVSVSGAKNAALKAMAASILFDGPVRLENIPRTNDIETLVTVLGGLGAGAEWTEANVLSIDASLNLKTVPDPELSGKMRASVVLTGPLLSRFGSVIFPAPGGCVIGARPIDLFLDGYSRMGASIGEAGGCYSIHVPEGRRLSGTDIVFSKISVGATETLMMAAVLAEGTTVLSNCAMEPEISSVAEWLNACGADIRGHGTPTMTIRGSNGRLLKPKVPYHAMPDRIEAGSYLLLGAMLAKDLEIRNCRPEHIESVISLLRASGVAIETTSTSIWIRDNAAPNSTLKAFDVKTHEYPGFPTDLQPPVAVFLTQVSGQSSVEETIFEGRFKYVSELKGMGANIREVSGNEILIKGPSAELHPPQSGMLYAPDIRAGFAIVMAALAGGGTFCIGNVHLIDRGYEKLEERLAKLGAKITRRKCRD